MVQQKGLSILNNNEQIERERANRTATSRSFPRLEEFPVGWDISPTTGENRQYLGSNYFEVYPEKWTRKSGTILPDPSMLQVNSCHLGRSIFIINFCSANGVFRSESNENVISSLRNF